MIYSNSWDHSYAPDKMFAAWAGCLAPDGRLYLEHSALHEVVNDLDPFGATKEALVRFVSATGLIHSATLKVDEAGVARRQILVFARA
jgi:hypothetical protein